MEEGKCAEKQIQRKRQKGTKIFGKSDGKMTGAIHQGPCGKGMRGEQIRKVKTPNSPEGGAHIIEQDIPLTFSYSCDKMRGHMGFGLYYL